MMNSQGVTGGSLTASNGGSGGSLVEAHKRGGGGGEGVEQQEGAVHVVDSPPPSPMTAAARALEQASITDAAYLVNVALETQHQKRQRQPQPQLPQFQSSVPSIPIDAASYDDDDDDGDPGGETFEDEPVEEVAVESAAFTDNKKKNPVKRGRRLRPKRTVEATSYWSSDDDSSPPLRQTPRAAVTKRKSKNTAASKQQQQQQKKTSLRHVVENEVKELVIDEEESLPHTIQPSPQQQRILPPLLVAAETATTPIASVISDKPPVAVVRTKKSALSPQPISTKRSVAFDSSNSARGNLTPNTNINRYPSPRVSASTTTTAGTFPRLSMEDVEIMQRLDDEYERALEEREVGYMARYASVRQAACLSVVFMLVFLILGTTFYVRYTGNWSVHDSLLFSIYTITTVGTYVLVLLLMMMERFCFAQERPLYFLSRIPAERYDMQLQSIYCPIRIRVSRDSQRNWISMFYHSVHFCGDCNAHHYGTILIQFYLFISDIPVCCYIASAHHLFNPILLRYIAIDR